MTALLDERELGEFIDAHYKAAGDRLFRMERLPRYDVPHQTAELQRWLAGETEPNWETKQPWLDTLADERRRGLVSQRVRVFGAQLSSDELRSCHWGYALNGRYEDIRVLHAGEHAIPPDLMTIDYWIVAETYAVPMHYDPHGRFLGAEVAPADRLADFVRDRDRAWAAAEPFDTWWARHRELHRRPAG
jgi:hypothetical protein